MIHTSRVLLPSPQVFRTLPRPRGADGTQWLSPASLGPHRCSCLLSTRRHPLQTWPGARIAAVSTAGGAGLGELALHAWGWPFAVIDPEAPQPWRKHECALSHQSSKRKADRTLASLEFERGQSTIEPLISLNTRRFQCEGTRLRTSRTTHRYSDRVRSHRAAKER